MSNAVLRPTDIHPVSPPAYPVPRVAAARLPRWSLLLISMTTLLAVAVIALVILVLKRDPRRAAAAAPPPPQARTERGNEANTEQPPATHRPRTAVSQPAEADVPLMKRNDAPAALKSPFQDPLLEIVGSLTATHLYQTYLNINLLADGAEAELYSRADANKMLDEVNDLLTSVERQLVRIPEKMLKDEDRQSLAQVHVLMGLLRTQAKELKAYWDRGDKEHAERFHKAREAAGTGIRDLLDLPD